MFKTLGLFDADRHRSLVERRLLGHAPPQVDRLKAKAAVRAELSQLRKDVTLQRVALLDKVAKRGADEDAKGA
ncbi:MAG: hypothetical protein ACXVIB_06210 [Halobacteriota archaeon]